MDRQLQHPRRLPPRFLAPYFAAKAAMDALAVSYAAEVLPFGIDTAIVVPGAFTTGTNHFTNAGTPADADRAEVYDQRHRPLMDDLGKRLAALIPPAADVTEVADTVARLVAMAHGTRPLRTHIDPTGLR
ncbi:hypothetical protein ACFYZJ_32630 [Streptomyces sp. NPDC001848]|uniref:hypothetical protein n=1 Tax=Streptomyces sp. NPDC001848 TaxID=3364618 RepID=UPI0036C2606C